MEIERSYPDIAAMLVMVEKRRESGYTFNDRLLVPGMSAAAVPIRGKEGRPVAALRIPTIESRVQDERHEDCDHQSALRRRQKDAHYSPFLWFAQPSSSRSQRQAR